MEPGAWSLLEVAKLAVSMSVPVITAIFLFRINRFIKDLENVQWTNRKLIEKRLDIYDKTVPLLNDLLCFYNYVGNWKEIDPLKIIEIKRQLDKIFNIYSPLFTSNLLGSYQDFIHKCFKTFAGMGKNAIIKSDFSARRLYNKNAWQNPWDNLFSPNLAENPAEIRKSYNSLINIFRKELSIYHLNEENY